MKTQGEIEAAICEGISQFEQEYMGRGPKDSHGDYGVSYARATHGLILSAFGSGYEKRDVGPGSDAPPLYLPVL